MVEMMEESWVVGRAGSWVLLVENLVVVMVHLLGYTKADSLENQSVV